jgi:hypothetical protein
LTSPLRQYGANTIGSDLCRLWFLKGKRVNRSTPRYRNINGGGKRQDIHDHQHSRMLAENLDSSGPPLAICLRHQ